MDTNSKMKPNALLELISSVISAFIFLLSTLLGWFIPNSSVFLFISGFLLIGGIFVKIRAHNNRVNYYAKIIVWCSAVVCLLSIVTLICYKSTIYKNDNNKMLCDFTHDAILVPENDTWLVKKKIADFNKVMYCYGPSTNAVTDEHLCEIIFDNSLFKEGDKYPIVRPKWNGISSKYSLLIVEKDKIKPISDIKFLKTLPYSVNLTVCGYLNMCISDWNNALIYLEKGYRERNGFAAYCLYIMYSNGCGMKPDEDKAIYYLRQSANMGYSQAQYEYGISLLNSDNSTDIIKGVNYLKNASILTDYQTGQGYLYMLKSIDALQEHFKNTGQFKEAYSFTKKITKTNKLEDLNYLYHLDNCILTNKIREADRIIKNGKKSLKKAPNTLALCLIAESKIYSQGLGRHNTDLSRAEICLRFASDSLDSNYARKCLSELYLSNKHEKEAEFWKKLYEIDFHRIIK